MKKAEFVKAVADKTGETQASVKAHIDAIAEIINEELNATGESSVPGIVKFHVNDKPARLGRNPKTGESITIPACRKVTCKAGKDISLN